jgi:exoribonuclease R
MTAIGIVELHGGKLILNVSDDQQIQIFSEDYMPGDKISMTTAGESILLERREQAGIGVVKSIESNHAKLYMANLGSSCPFSPKIEIKDTSVKIGDRLVVWFESNGRVALRGVYSSDALDDVPCLLKMYSLYKKPDNFTYLVNDHNKPLYTIDYVVNHNNLNTFTIDPATSQDFDDAISVDVDNNTVYIHIVDIVKADCDGYISAEARRRLKERCLTLYLSNEHTEHLLDPEAASTTLSLIKNCERDVITVKAVLNENGTVNNYDIYRSTIIVKHRLDYDGVSQMLAERNVPPDIQFLVNLSNLRSSNVKYNINLPSLRFNIDKPSGLIDTLKIESTNDESHNLVATAMILANLIVSKHLHFCQITLPNRFHESLHGMSNISFTTTNNELVDSFILVKRYARACYSIDKRGHFGLGITDYVHFTSPMRRYADVLVHKLLSGTSFNDVSLEEEVDWLNFRAHAVRSIQDLYINWKLMRYIQTPSNKEKYYEVWITDVKKGGVLWFMPSLSLNGFAHVSTLNPKQFWYYDYSKKSLEGQSNSSVVTMGRKMMATISSVDPITSCLYLTIYSD